ncbi:MAG: transglutaminase family protein [Acidimicrobiales bacterium]
MSIHVALEHRTTYRFDKAVSLTPHVVRLRPAAHCRTPILSYSMTVEPSDHFINWQQDPFGNFEARLVFPKPTTKLEIVVDLVADLTVINPFDFFLEPDAERIPFAYDPDLLRDLGPYLEHEPPGPLLAAWLAEVELPAAGTPTVDFLVALNQRLQHDIAYTTRLEPGVQEPEVTLERALGSCRDSGWLLVQVLRNLGLAARFVSGYLVQLTADDVPLDGPAGPEADFTDLHAWCEVFIPGAGWVGLDPTSGLFAGEGHLPLAATPRPASAAPITGSTEPCEVTFDFANQVTRIHEDPRVTLPYTAEQWKRIDGLGHEVDERLRAGDVRLTQGGEPTFVSVDDMDAPEWTVAADGEDKRARAWDLTLRLAEAFAPGGLVQAGQGKWYPGEPLPRWELGVHWRADGEALWSRPDLLLGPFEPGSATADQAEALARSLARRLGLAPAFVHPAYEDPLDALARAARLPAGAPPEVDIDPSDPGLASDDGRARLLAAIDAAAGEPVAWVMPVHHLPEGVGGWATAEWVLRRGRLVLVPGDSPASLRLPLDSLTWSPAPPQPERSTFEPVVPLPEREGGSEGPVTPPPAAVVPVGEAPPTALGVEVRDGRLSVFLPPLTHLEHAVALLAVVEAAVVDGGVPVVIEGYAPPRDPRLRTLVVTPDPGVIEVNLHPASSWAELVATTEVLYAEAKASRLGTEKFELDGTHSGSGGGNHVTLGGMRPADSPLLRRPDLLRSLVTYWQHHPSLSYLFSGRFIGPTSQAPRVDEARHDALDELEIAFGELDRLGADVAPWLVDRLFRHLLVDLTGNTHRAEFCIDKLFTPEAERGRLGLVELRGFEMPPHPQMALVQALLVRALVARLWEDPFEARLVRWGTELHDRFLLPHEVASDIAAVADDLLAHGIDFELSWLDPFLEFRFPRLGTLDVGGVHLELRAAIEPWLVLGEEVSLAATSRYVDSSVERLQVRVEGLAPGRHVITCNGRAIPLRATATPGTWVAGVRYRAWQPPSALHPTIGVHSPLVFDVVDLQSGRSLGGCTYRVDHPGGRNYDRFPVNANEADARRTSRFSTVGHTPGPVDVPRLEAELAQLEGYPRTLDLRRPAKMAAGATPRPPHGT